MKKFLSIIFTIVLIITVFAGCTDDKADPVTTEEHTTIQTVDKAVDELTEDVSVENTTTDKDGNEVIVGTDKDGNTVEIKTEPDGTVTKTVTDKTTGKKTEQTTKATTVPSATEDKKKPVTTTKPSAKPQITEKQTTTKKPAPQNTTAPKPTNCNHNWVTKTEKVLIKEAYTEPVTATVPVKTPTYHCTCGAWFNVTNCKRNPATALTFHVEQNNGINGSHADVGYFTMEPIPGEYETITTGSISHPAEYKTKTYQVCSKCGKTKSA